MSVRHARLDRCAHSEMALAAFNANRTGTLPATAIAPCEAPPWLQVCDPGRPAHPYYNRAVAARVGSLTPGDLDTLPASVVAVELRPSELNAALADALLARGFRPRETLCYLGARPRPRSGPGRDAVERLAPAQVDAFLDALESTGTPFPPERRAQKRAFYCTETFQAFVARGADGGMAGWATLFVHGSAAFLGNAYVRPRERGRGLHAALLAARLDAAAEAGLDEVFTDVEHGSQSHANCERIGLHTLAVNTVWQRG